jgi:hypothetical protein
MFRQLLAFIILILCIADALGQERNFGFELVKDVSSVEEFAWGKEIAYQDFEIEKLASYPDDEAILIKKHRFITTQKVGGKLRYWNIQRRVIYLQEAGAVEDFSSLTYSDLNLKEKFNDYAVRIFKKNGEIIYLRRDAFTEDGDEIKIVLPGIAVGDIIDYYSFLRMDVYVSKFRVFESDAFYFADAYPVLDQYVEILLKKGVYFKFMSMNEAPEVKIQDTGLQYGFKAKVTIEKSDMPAADIDERWIYPYREFPVVRYAMAVNSGDNFLLKRSLFDASGKASTTTDRALINDMLGSQAYFDGLAIGIKNKYLKRIKARIAASGLSSDREKVEAFYKELLYLLKVDPDTYDPYFSNSKMLSYLAEYCLELGVRSDWLYVVPRFFGSRDNLLLPEEFYRVFRMSFELDTVYVQEMDLYYPFNKLPNFLEGSEGYKLANHKRYSATADYPQLVEIGTSKAKENGVFVAIDIALEGDSLTGEVFLRNHGVEANGSLRRCDEGESCRFLQRFLPRHYYLLKYGDEDEKKLTMQELTELQSDEVKIEDEATTDNLNSFSEWMISTAQLELEGRFGADRIADIDTMHIIETGLETTEKGFSYNTRIRLGGLATDLGGDKLIEIGQLIGGQVAIGQENRERKSNVYYDNARSYTTEIRFTIPDGYTVEGLEALHYDIDNERGGFKSSAEMKEGILEVTATKYYNDNFVDKEDWPLLLEFIDAAYDFSQKKVLLEKI